jgi:DNA-binding GntR family transcriptional regulator
MTAGQLNSREPLYIRIYNELSAQIAAGTLSRAGRLPPERVISEQLGVSRATIRRALAALEADGLIEAVQGRGTFVTTPRLVEPPNALMSFSDLARERGTEAGAEVLDAHTRPATIDEADRFRIAPGGEVYDLTRLRTVDSVAVALDRNIIPLSFAPQMSTADWATTSLYALLADSGSTVVRADYALEARAADDEQARRLGLPRGAPILVADTRGYGRGGRLVQIGETAYRGDRYRFRTTLIKRP